MKQPQYRMVIGLLLAFAIGAAVGWSLHSLPQEKQTHHLQVKPFVAEAVPPATNLAEVDENIESECIPCNEAKNIRAYSQNSLPNDIAHIQDKSTDKSEQQNYELVTDKSWADLLQMAEVTPDALIDLVFEQYRNETELNTREWLVDLLRSANPPNLKELSLQLAKSDDPLKRQLAFELLQNKSLEDKDVLQTVLEALDNEHDAKTLALACSAANPVLLNDQDSNQIADRFRNLARHENSEVRGWSIIQLAAWDKESPDVVYIINDGLMDTSTEVMNCALSAITATHLQSSSIQGSLWNIASDKGMQFEARETAIRLLAESPMSNSDRNRLKYYANNLVNHYQQSEAANR